jgi:single-stranded DNA-binding protein
MNAVSLIGTLTDPPDLQEPQSGPYCTMRLAVPRRSRTGRSEPGVVYVGVTTFGENARECGRLKLGSRIGLSGRIDGDPPHAGTWVLIDQLDLL